MSALNRLREPSSYGGLGLILTALPQLAGNHFDPIAWGQLITGLISVLVPEKKVA